MKRQDRVYAMESLIGKNPYEAARISGLAFPNVSYMRMEHKPAVQAVLGLARHKRDKKIDLLSGLLENILLEMPKVEWKGSDMLKAIEILAKLQDLMPEKSASKALTLNFFDVKDANPQQLWLRLQEIKEQQDQAIDAEIVQPSEEPQEEAI